ncbi:MAG: efflux RND transporter periplasmic adaptor subunit [Bdellovibrionales bacterium]|nr:efflux RND transporter periplasmic adaptor subunit [Bdellovibrionales bacterium]
MGILIGLGLAAGWYFTLGPSGAISVETGSPQRGMAVEAVYATGTVEATVMMPIAARVTARLMQLNTDEGHDVKEGDVLAQLEDSDLQKTLDELKARANFLQKDYDRKAALAKSGYETRATLDQARAELDAIRAGIARAEAEASYTRLIAPADGRVIQRDGEIGQIIPAGQPVFWLSCCAPLRISAEVDEEDIPRVTPGQQVLIRADAFPDAQFEGEVLAITPKGDPVARSYRVRISLAPDTPLHIGMTAENNIIIQEKPDTLLIPTTAIRDNAVYVIENNILHKRGIKTGIRGLEKTEITEGLNGDEIFALVATSDLEDGMRIRKRKAP